jgi:hypothetical protein
MTKAVKSAHSSTHPRIFAIADTEQVKGRDEMTDSEEPKLIRTGLQDRILGTDPWQVLPPVKSEEESVEEPDTNTPQLGTRENPYVEGAFSWWVEGEPSDQHVFCNEAEVHNSEYPDFIWDLLLSRNSNLH